MPTYLTVPIKAPVFRFAFFPRHDIIVIVKLLQNFLVVLLLIRIKSGSGSVKGRHATETAGTPRPFWEDAVRISEEPLFWLFINVGCWFNCASNSQRAFSKTSWEKLNLIRHKGFRHAAIIKEYLLSTILQFLTMNVGSHLELLFLIK